MSILHGLSLDESDYVARDLGFARMKLEQLTLEKMIMADPNRPQFLDYPDEKVQKIERQFDFFTQLVSKLEREEQPYECQPNS